MGKVLTLISGKGGSGKTTLGLAVAKLLVKCEKKVLLIDCDISTHGATYFFEDKLTNEVITTAYDVFYSNELTKRKIFINTDSLINEDLTFVPIKSSKLFDFVPSVKQISDKCGGDYIANAEFDDHNFRIIKDNYDIVILDCQAGYSNFTKRLIGVSDVSLFVLEADAVSASAMRVLYTKLFNELNIHKLQTYQIFNKVQEIEVEIYSNTKFGTFFTNIKPVMFDWSVRNAFQENMIPLIDTENSAFTSDMCRLTRSLFPMYANDIIKYEVAIKEKIIMQENEKIKVLDKRGFTYSLNKAMRSLLYLTIIMLLIMVVVLLGGGIENINSGVMGLIILVCIIICVALLELVEKRFLSKDSFDKEIKQAEDNVKKLESEIALLKDQE